MTVFTIGHSNHSFEKMAELLRQHAIDVVADLRSSPYSKYSSQFNKAEFERALVGEGIRYVFLGDVIGGRPEGDEFYDEEGYVLYDRVAASERFSEGIDRLLKGAEGHRVALLCGEEDPTACHRRLLVGRVLCERGVELVHIRGDGRVQSEAEVASEAEFNKTGGQISLFDEEEPEPWRSTQSVLPKKAPPNSSGYLAEPGFNG